VNVAIHERAEGDLEEGYDYYETARAGLGEDFLTEFRRAIDRIIANPRGWQPLDLVYRRCRLRRFPYGVIYRIDDSSQQILVIAIMHLSRHPDLWRRRID
jgi:plasmid stabilization system protein ParE